ncbi:MAG: hypothetical protein NC911_06885, partial [Candidatus Omnitrophica bacterium]|nr:hypothetical protein [Candidatus Omnitrophota bacterium]
MFEELRYNEATQGIPVLLCSLPEKAGPSSEQGAVLALDYLAKPMAPVALTEALYNLGLADRVPTTSQTILIADDDPAILAL